MRCILVAAAHHLVSFARNRYREQQLYISLSFIFGKIELKLGEREPDMLS